MRRTAVVFWSIWPQRLTVVGVGIAMHTLILNVVNDGDTVGRKDE